MLHRHHTLPHKKILVIIHVDSLIEICQVTVPYVRVLSSNHTKHDVTLSRRTALGNIESVAKVLQTDELDLAPSSATQTADNDEPHEIQQDKDTVGGSVAEKWDPPVNISHLSGDQQEMLREESGAFAQYHIDIGCITSLEMSITLNDNTPCFNPQTPLQGGEGVH